jgi:F-type H+-transporting ATPase subunit b
MEIMPDPMVMALQMVPFLVTLAALYKIILLPMLDYLDDRTKAIESGTKGVDALNAQIEARTAEYEAQLKIARSKASDIRAAKRAEAKASYEDKIMIARKESDGRVHESIEEIRLLAGKAREELKESSQSLADQISTQVLGRRVGQG